jgi:hypothetical protein
MTAFARSLRATVATLHLDRLRTVRERIDPAWIAAALEGQVKLAVRRRKLPPDVVIWLVVGISLYGEKSFTDVLRAFALTPLSRRGNAQTDPTSGAIAQARQRLGSAPLRTLVQTATRHWLDSPELEHLRYRGLRVLAADGVSMCTPDTPSNAAAFGKPDSRKDGAAFPQLRAVCLLDVATHLILDAAVGKYTTGEHDLLLDVVPSIPERSVTILDRNFISWALLHRLHVPQTRRHFLVRSKRTITYRDVQKLGDGDSLVEITTRADARNANPDLPRRFQLRRLTYKVNGKPYILLTTLLDPAEFSAEELIQLYRRRWEIELAYDDAKTEMRAAALTLRSKLPDGARQEFYGMLLAHNLVRTVMASAAKLIDVEPTRISFHRALHLVRETLVSMGRAAAPSKLGTEVLELRQLLRYLLLPERRSHRVFPRALRVVVPRYPRKGIGEPQVPP